MSGLFKAKFESIDSKGNVNRSEHSIGKGIMTYLDSAVEETIIEAFTRVVANTPIKSGTLISGWRVYVGDSAGMQLISYENTSENTPIEWSRQKAHDLAGTFREALTPHVKGSMPVMRYKIENTVYHAAMIEDGRYAGHVYEYVVKPYYVFPTPFLLTTSGWSLKAMTGMVQVVAIETDSIFRQKMQGV